MHVGQRVSLAGFHGTVKYIGPVEDSPSTWIGLEWDDPARGKHSGTYKGKKVFSCRDGSGSFLKEAKVTFDTTRAFIDAVTYKYVDGPAILSSEVTVVPGFTKPMQAIGFDRVKQHYKDITRATELFLTSSLIERFDLAGLGSINFDNLVTLDLSWNLLSDIWELAEFCLCLPKLRILKLEGNRFDFSCSKRSILPLRTVRDLSLNIANITWLEVAIILETVFPEISTLHLALNGLDDALPFQNQCLRDLDMHGNNVSNVHSILKHLPNLEHLNLSNNQISTIPILDHDTTSKIRHLNLAKNPLKDLSQVQNLSCYKGLKSLSYTLTLDDKADERSRLQLIKHLPQLEIVNRTKITQQERNDAAQFGVSHTRASQIMSENFCSLTFISSDSEFKKNVLRTQSIKQVKATFARLAKIRPAKISSLIYSDGTSEIVLNDELAPLSYYGVASAGFITAVIE